MPSGDCCLLPSAWNWVMMFQTLHSALDPWIFFLPDIFSSIFAQQQNRHITIVSGFPEQEAWVRVIFCPEEFISRQPKLQLHMLSWHLNSQILVSWVHVSRKVVLKLESASKSPWGTDSDFWVFEAVDQGGTRELVFLQISIWSWGCRSGDHSLRTANLVYSCSLKTGSLPS